MDSTMTSRGENRLAPPLPGAVPHLKIFACSVPVGSETEWKAREKIGTPSHLRALAFPLESDTLVPHPFDSHRGANWEENAQWCTQCSIKGHLCGVTEHRRIVHEASWNSQPFPPRV